MTAFSTRCSLLATVSQYRFEHLIVALRQRLFSPRRVIAAPHFPQYISPESGFFSDRSDLTGAAVRCLSVCCTRLKSLSEIIGGCRLSTYTQFSFFSRCLITLPSVSSFVYKKALEFSVYHSNQDKEFRIYNRKINRKFYLVHIIIIQM
ncbi:MAG: hypothetical protein OSJ43_08310 [Oscillospiraceae bacterium]|nr:hypothetical protein [Oscillospiraceae bacterium]